MKRETYTIDAAGKVVGRIATQIALLLRGKNKVDFVPYKDVGDEVLVKNVDKLKFTGKKLEQTKVRHHSLYLGGLKETPLKKIFKENPERILRKAVYGMMPSNKLRDVQIKRLKIER